MESKDKKDAPETGAGENSEAKKPEWKISENSDGTLLVVREGSDGTSETASVPNPDLTGADMEMIVAMCNRFKFSVRGLVDECRFSDYKRNAQVVLSNMRARE